MEEKTIEITQSRYDEFRDMETRINVAVNYIAHSSFVNKETMLRMLGTSDAVKFADELRMKDEEEREAHERKYGEPIESLG